MCHVTGCLCVAPSSDSVRASTARPTPSPTDTPSADSVCNPTPANCWPQSLGAHSSWIPPGRKFRTFLRMKFYLRILSLLLLLAAALTQDGFNLEDALFDDPTPAPPKKQPVTPKRPGSDGGFGLDLEDAFGPDPTPKKPQKPSSGDTGGFGLDLEDALGPDPTPKKPRKPSSGDTGGFDLEDALGPDPAPEPKKPADKPRSGGGGTFGDNDLFDVSNGDYKPDEGRSGGRAKDTSYDNQGGNDQAQDPDLLWGQILKMLNSNMPEEFFMWMSNLKQVLGPLLEKAKELLQALP